MIQLLPLGPVASRDLSAAVATIRARFRCDCEVLACAPLPAHAYRAARQQYDADVILDFLFDRLTADVLRLVALTESDLFAEGRNFVFGYAHMRDRVAVFSSLRLRERFWGRADDEKLLRSRVDKALTHELGHTFHAPHCETPRCVMHQVEFLWQLDELDDLYCPSCARCISAAAKVGVRTGQALFELAGSYMRRRRFARAAAIYAAAAARAPDNAQYHNDHGVALLAVGDRASASQAFHRAIGIAPSAPHAYYNLGILSRERGDIGAADWYFAEALRRDQDSRAATRYLGILHQDYFRDPARARRYFEHYRAMGGEDADVLGRLASLGVVLRPRDDRGAPVKAGASASTSPG